MRGWLRVIAAIATAFAILAAVAVYWLFYDNRMPSTGRFPLSIAELRRAAAAIPGAGPQRIEVETLSHTLVPRIGMVAGTDWGKIDVLRASYRLVYPGRSIVLDTGNSLALARQFGAARYDSGAWRRIQEALDRANAIVVTHEHADHIGGLIESPHVAALMKKARLLPEQVDAGARSSPLVWPAGVRDGYHPLRYARLYTLAPGVVLIRAPGHTPGSQMVYVRRADGREFLFAGDTASNADHIRLQRIRPHYTTDWLGADDRLAVMLQTQALGRLVASDPQLVLVPGHDSVVIQRLIRDGTLKHGFDG